MTTPSQFSLLVSELRDAQRCHDARTLRDRMACTMRWAVQAHRDGEIDAHKAALLVARVHAVDNALGR